MIIFYPQKSSLSEVICIIYAIILVVRNFACCFVVMTHVADICTGTGTQSGGTPEEACGV